MTNNKQQSISFRFFLLVIFHLFRSFSNVSSMLTTMVSYVIRRWRWLRRVLQINNIAQNRCSNDAHSAFCHLHSPLHFHSTMHSLCSLRSLHFFLCHLVFMSGMCVVCVRLNVEKKIAEYTRKTTRCNTHWIYEETFAMTAEHLELFASFVFRKVTPKKEHWKIGQQILQ